MAAIILPHRWTRRPSGNAEINWSNPLANGIVVALIPGANEAVRGGPVVIANGGALAPRPHGLGFTGSAWLSDDVAYAPNGYVGVGTANLTDLVVTELTGDATNFSYACGSYSGATDGVMITLRHSGVSEHWGVYAGGSIIDSTEAGVIGAGAHTFAFTRDGSTQYLYRNGVLRNSVSAANAATSTAQFCIGNILTSGGSFSVGPTANIALALRFQRFLGASEIAELTRAPWQLFRPLRRRLYFAPPAAGQTITVNQASETDLAQAVTRSKLKALGQPAETDLAQAVARGKLKALGQPAETDVAQALTAAKRAALGQVAETDQAQTVTRGGVFQAVNQATETATAQAIARLKTVALAQATESDSAQAVARSKRKTLGQPAESDAAQALAHAKAKLLGQAAETDLAQTVTPELPNQLSAAAETDSAQAVARAKAKAVGQSAETDLAQAVSRAKTGGVGLALEIDLGQPVVWAPKHRLVAPALETDLAQAIVPGLASTVLPKGKRHLVGARATHIVGARRAFGVDP